MAAGLLFSQEPNQPKPKSQKEAEAVMAIFNAQDPDARIKAAEELLAKFADTEFKAVALQVAAMSAQQKNDFEKMVIYAERTLEADPKNYQAKLMLASGIAQRTREHDLDKEEKLKRSEKYANEALEDLKTAQKPNPQITDEQWESAKKDLAANAHEALGLTAMVRKKYDVAAKEFDTAVTTAATPEPTTLVRLAAAYNQLNKPDEAIAALDKVNTLPEVHPQIKAAAQNERNNAIKIKSGAAKPASAAPQQTTPAPAQVEIKK
jgi:tetratricopeptide (TPR) repeat protein